MGLEIASEGSTPSFSASKNNIGVIMYLELKFHDNDFSIPMFEAISELYKYIKENNYDKKPLDIFKGLHNANQLIPMINRLCVLRTLAREVETMTRAIKDEGVWETFKAPWLDNLVPISEKYTEYFRRDLCVEFHEKRHNEFQNGEHIWLDLDSGKVNIQ